MRASVVTPSVLNLMTCLVLVLTSSVPPVTDTGQGTVSSSYKDDITSSASLTSTTTQTGPRVDVPNSGNVSTVLGKTASLRCRVLNRTNHTVSWIRHRDLHLLTVDQYTYTSDQRFQAMYESSTGDWILLVASVQLRDRGIYECQIGTTPPLSHFVALNIVEPRTEILGGSDLHINTGSTINLTCLVLYHARSPHSLTWLHEGQEVHYDSARGGVTVLTEAGEVTRSALLIQKATRADSGNYTCQPSGAASATARVHILHEHRAAMQEGVAIVSYRANTTLLMLMALWAVVWADLPFRGALWADVLLHGPVWGALVCWMILGDLNLKWGTSIKPQAAIPT